MNTRKCLEGLLGSLYRRTVGDPAWDEDNLVEEAGAMEGALATKYCAQQEEETFWTRCGEMVLSG
jgi:hypothetical protein